MREMPFSANIYLIKSTIKESGQQERKEKLPKLSFIFVIKEVFDSEHYPPYHSVISFFFFSHRRGT